MNSIISLRADDFKLEQGQKGLIMTSGIKGISLVMFYSPLCKNCNELFPKFRHLPQVINNIRFCVLNINENRSIIELSRKSISPIEFVPYILLYVNGIPFSQYDDHPTLEKLIAFLNYSSKLIEAKKSFIDRKFKIESEIPKYSIAKPYIDFKCDENTGACYLSYSEAYQGLKAQDNTGQNTIGNTAGNVLEATNQSKYFQSS